MEGYLSRSKSFSEADARESEPLEDLMIDYRERFMPPSVCAAGDPWARTEVG